MTSAASSGVARTPRLRSALASASSASASAARDRARLLVAEPLLRPEHADVAISTLDVREQLGATARQARPPTAAPPARRRRSPPARRRRRARAKWRDRRCGTPDPRAPSGRRRHARARLGGRHPGAATPAPGRPSCSCADPNPGSEDRGPRGRRPPEVEQHRAAVAHDQVLRMDVPVRDAGAVQRGEQIDAAQPGTSGRRLVRRQSPAGRRRTAARRPSRASRWRHPRTRTRQARAAPAPRPSGRGSPPRARRACRWPVSRRDRPGRRRGSSVPRRHARSTGCWR